MKKVSCCLGFYNYYKLSDCMRSVAIGSDGIRTHTMAADIDIEIDIDIDIEIEKDIDKDNEKDKVTDMENRICGFQKMQMQNAECKIEGRVAPIEKSGKLQVSGRKRRL